MYKESGLGTRGRRMRFDNFARLKGKIDALELSRGWEIDCSRGLVFYGPPGTGKTHLACSIANHEIQSGVFTRFLRTVRIPKNDSEEIERLSDPDQIPLLILDDLGAEKGTERALECLYSIIDGRIWNEAHLIITTNYRPDALKERLNAGIDGFGDRILSRLKGYCEFVPVGGEDMRGVER